MAPIDLYPIVSIIDAGAVNCAHLVGKICVGISMLDPIAGINTTWKYIA